MTQSKEDTTTTKRGIFGFSPEEIHQMAWSFSNFTAVAGTTSASIVAVQSPTRTFLVNMTKYGQFMPAYSGGTMGFFRALYAGTSASLSGSVARTAYVTNTKNHRPVEAVSEERVKEEGKLARGKMGYVMAAAFGDIVITQIPESLSTLKKVPGLLPQNFKWYTPFNSWQLMKGGFGARYTSGLVNFSALCVVEDWIAQRLPVADKNRKHFLAGALSGATAGFISYPCTALKDLTLVGATTSLDGRVSIPTTSSIVKGIVKDFKENPRLATKTAFVNSGKQLIVRVPLTSTIFGIISFVGECMGPEPLREIVPERFQPPTAKNPQGFFGGGSSPKVEVVEEVTAVNTTETSTTSSPKAG